MTDINPYSEMSYEPEQIRDFIDEGNSYSGYACELFEELETHFHSYEQLYDQAVEREIPDGVFLDAENFDKARAELEVANKLMERLVIDLQNRDGASSIADCTIVYEGDSSTTNGEEQ